MHGRLRSIVLLTGILVGLGTRAFASANATITVNGTELSGDSGTIKVAFNGFTETVQYGQFSTPASVASALGAMFSRDYTHAGLSAQVLCGATTVITFGLHGSETFGALDVTGSTTSFHLTSSGFSSQGSQVFDSGTIQLTVNGLTAATTTYAAGATPDTVAAGLVNGITAASPVTLSEANGSLYLVSKTTGLNTDYSYTLQTTSWDSAVFTEPSFVPGGLSGNLDGGANANSAGGQVYSFSIPSYVQGSPPTGYDAVGNVVGYTDSSTGAWGFGYDTLNRLTGAAGTQPGGTVVNACWAYDSFGNRTLNYPAACASGLTQTQGYNTNNQMTGGLISYDGAGNIKADTTGGKSYVYDAEGRICAMSFSVSGISIQVGYIYNAEGERVAKGSITTMSCDPVTNGFQPMTDYVVGPNGAAVSDVVSDGMGNMIPQHTHVYAGAQLMATYDSEESSSTNQYGLNYRLTDWLGSVRATADNAGTQIGTCANMPFGDQFNCQNFMPDQHLFTGKERDAESGNDYFEARYFGSSMGRFLSPDFGGPMPDMPDAVPWADYENPQSLNLYSYVQNNPLTGTDPDGHACVVQTRTGDNTEQVSVASQEDCSGVTVGDGQSATYVNGTVNVGDISAGADGHSINIGFTSYDGSSSGVQNSSSAPYPDSPNLDPHWSNNAQGYGLLGAANTTVKYASIGVAATFGSLGATIAATDLIAGEALTTLGDLTATPTAGEVSSAQNTLATGGRKGVEKAIRTLSKRIAEHQDKIDNATGNTGSMEREVATWRRAIQALQQVLR